MSMSSNVRVGNNGVPCLRLGMHALKNPDGLGGESSASGLAALTLTEVFNLRKTPPAAEGPAPWSGLLTDRVVVMCAVAVTAC